MHRQRMLEGTVARRGYAKMTRTVEGLTRDEACYRYRGKVDLVARRVAERLPRDASVPVSYTHLTLPTNREV